MSKSLMHCKFGDNCRSLRGGQPCRYLHLSPSITRCKFGERCRSFRGGHCNYDHSPTPEQLAIQKMVAFMKEQGKIHAHTTAIPCAIQYSYHSYSPDKQTATVYTTIDGTTVFVDGFPIDESLLFANAHYGAMGGSHGYPNRQSIVAEVRKMYYDWYTQHTMSDTVIERLEELPVDGLFRRPEPIVARMSYCGN